MHLRARNGALVPLSAVVELREVGAVQELRRVDRLAAVEIDANFAPGATQGDMIARTEATAAASLPGDAPLRWLGESLDLQETGQAVLVIFALVLVLTFLVLAARFESFLHPLIVMTAAPLALAGGLLLGTLLTLFVVPVAYARLARFTGAPGARAAEVRRLEAEPRDAASQPAE